MDTLRGNFDGYGSTGDDGSQDDEAVYDSPPPAFGTDERRMQVRAYNFWASLLQDRNFPHVEDLDPDLVPDFGPNGVLLDFSRGIEDPAITFLGDKLADECGANGAVITRLSDVPARSLLSRITDHYMQILANQAPIGFEAEFVNQRGSTILYRGILLPFSSDNDTIDFIYGVINWKELADAHTADELLLEIDQALDTGRSAVMPQELADCADGPGAAMPSAASDPLPVPSFGLNDDHLNPSLPVQSETRSASLADCLAAARELAMQARSSEDRTRSALYAAIGQAHDFALAAADQPQEFAEMLADSGLAQQDRAPMTPVVKLVFGADYDKTRLTEYAAALIHAQRIGLGRGELAGYLTRAEGGLKGVVAAERALRRTEHGRPVAEPGYVARLRAMAPKPFAALSAEGDEFALVLVRRDGAGMVQMLGEVPADSGLVERAARKLAG
jgi:hypothetical protein